MKTFLSLFKNRSFLLALVLYLVSVLILSRRPAFSLSEALLELLIFGLAFSLLAWWLTGRARPLAVAEHPTGAEMIGLLLYVFAVSIYLVFGPQSIDSWLPRDWIASERIQFFVSLSRKLIVFVLLPFVLFGPLRGTHRRESAASRQGAIPRMRPKRCLVLPLQCMSGAAERIDR